MMRACVRMRVRARAWTRPTSSVLAYKPVDTYNHSCLNFTLPEDGEYLHHRSFVCRVSFAIFANKKLSFGIPLHREWWQRRFQIFVSWALIFPWLHFPFSNKIPFEGKKRSEAFLKVFVGSLYSWTARWWCEWIFGMGKWISNYKWWLAGIAKWISRLYFCLKKYELKMAVWVDCWNGKMNSEL